MKFSVSARQPITVLKKADEIYVKQRDYRKIYDFQIDYPEKDIVLEIEENENLDWEMLQSYAKNENFYIAVNHIFLGKICEKFGIKFFYSKPVNSFYDIWKLKEFGVCQICIEAPLTFDLKQVLKYDLPIRMCANKASDPHIITVPHGIFGTYIRPEDVDIYSDYVSTLTFAASEGLENEKALLEIYQEGQWNDNLALLVEGLRRGVHCGLLPDDFGIIRATCGQRCMRNGTCHYCLSAFEYSKALRDFLFSEEKENHLKN